MANVNLQQARYNMVEQQIRPWDVLDQSVLDLQAKILREQFVPKPFHNLAYSDTNIPLDHDEVMMEPKVEGRILQALQIKSHETVLEIGTGSGYLTALLASQARHVYSVDIHADFISAAREKLAAHDLYNVTFEHGDAANGWSIHAPYDVIVVTGSVPVLPDAFRDTLTTGGRLFVITGEAPIMSAQLITRVGPHEWRYEVLFETSIPSLKNAQQPNRFVL